jgi:hypothetical protein
MDYLLSSARAFSLAELLQASRQDWISSGSLAAKAGVKPTYKSKFFLQIFYPLRNYSWRAIVTPSLRLNCVAMTRELTSRSRGSRWRMAIERRRAIRYPVKLPASFSWEDEQRIMRQGEGRTRNISEKGVFVDAAICPPIGSSVEVRFLLPALNDSGRKMHVQHRGETLRLEGAEQREHSSGFAIKSRDVVWRYQD